MLTDSEMKALVWLGPEDMQLRTVSLPEPAPGEVLIETSAIGICGSELSGYLGQNSLRRPPLIMGHEASGRILQAGEQTTFADGTTGQVGTRVTFNPLIVCGACDRCRAGYTNLCRQRQLVGAHRPGAFASYVAVPATQCWPVPENLSDTAASLAEPLACAIRAVTLAHISPGDSLLIIGAGPIGLFCLAYARSLGITEILVSDMLPARLEIAQQWGASATLNARTSDVVQSVQQIYRGGAMAVIDAVGATATRAQAIQAVVPGGRVVFIGLHDEESPLAANYLIRQEVTITGSFAYTHHDFGSAVAMLKAGKLRSEADWLEERPLAEGPAAFAELVKGTARATKIVLRMR
ncbi:galactitol-1-phosphate 5-dehydrogenase [Ktedonobacter sp. SOSP1-85]|uniref:zinc-dependent alcohol dehydrogenase n=1 Tax=Ktedonobacter sp. SOSP1-85 TaxID=2778367 RepID=UPI001916B288|nr:galactitol-1-phosphate 5-dehydrogenase [Ktedonobacter sp. SOSP1-85]GHO78340.1 galactitol-1-phosphate 5-dehydrogenase [Ktedonobacter sp. SOSP1-85]